MIIVASNFSPSSCKFKRGILPPLKKKYPNLKSTCHIKPKLFLCTKLQKNIVLAKYHRSVAVALTTKRKKEIQ